MRNLQGVGARWLGVGLAAALAVVTLSLAVTDRLGLYINPESTWFAVSMARNPAPMACDVSLLVCASFQAVP